jgi:hypothetical protein
VARQSLPANALQRLDELVMVRRFGSWVIGLYRLIVHNRPMTREDKEFEFHLTKLNAEAFAKRRERKRDGQTS